MSHHRSALALAATLFVLSVAATALPQTVTVRLDPFASNVVIPQARMAPGRWAPAVQVTGVSARVEVLDKAAVTTLDISLHNPSSVRAEAELIIPVPEGAAVKSFYFDGKNPEPTARLLARDESRAVYESLVAKMRDPALLEFLGCNLVRSSVFPVEPRGMQKVRVVYEQVLTSQAGRVEYVLPRSESVDYDVPWDVSVEIRSNVPVATVYSPSHETSRDALADTRVKVNVSAQSLRQPGPFRLYWMPQSDGVTATFFAYPDKRAGGGYFLLVAGVPEPKDKSASRIKRDVTLVFDRSGSMRGEKIAQVREAAKQVIAGLANDETFNILAYNDSVAFFSRDPVTADAAGESTASKFLDSIDASGSTNIYDALSAALSVKPREGFLPIVLFLTDGLPTSGRTSEIAIREVVTKTNLLAKRVFTFGVGVDVNVPLLDRIASESRAASTYVLPKDDVEAKVAVVFKRLTGPVLASSRLDASPVDSASPGPSVADMIPSAIPDLFEGGELIVLGRYLSEQPLDFILKGNYLGNERTFRFAFDPSTARVANGFVPRLWASRRIGVLVDAVRQLGGEARIRDAAAHRDPRMAELTDEIVRLSTEYGVLTEYTAFIAEEGTNLADRAAVASVASSNFSSRAVRTRSGLGAANQSANVQHMAQQSFVNGQNIFLNEKMERSSTVAVQQVADMAFYNRSGRWIDSRVVTRETDTEPARTITFGSDEFKRLASRLAADNRQGSLVLRGDILMMVDGELVLVKNTVQ